VHCRNCDVFTAAGRDLLDREPPPGYGAGWNGGLGEAPEGGRGGARTVLVFRLGEELLAIPDDVVIEIVDWRPIRSIPHRRDEVLVGLANVSGDLRLCVSLEVLFGGPPTDPRVPRPRGRLIVIGKSSPEWVILADEALAMGRVVDAEIEAPPATVSRSSQAFLEGVIAWRNRRAGLLDAGLVLDALRRRVG
jgi:chemotaxis-related protein WspD